MSFHQYFAEWSQWFWPLFVNHLWQATLFALLVWGAVVVILKQAPARARQRAWLLGLLKFIVPSAWLVWGVERLGVARSARTSLAANGAEAELVFWQLVEPMAISPTITTHREIYCLLTIAWLAVAVALLLRWRLRRERFARIVRTEESVTTGRLADLFAHAQTQAGVSGRVTLLASAQVAEPGVWGVWRPAVILPVGLAEQLTDEELSAVVLHELFHVRHYDNLRSSWQMLLCCAFWFHPLVWLLDRRLLAARELICDENVLRCGNAADTYAAGLWKVVQHGLGWPVAGVSRATGADLKRRIELMLNTEPGKRNSLARRTLAGATFCLLLMVAVATAWLSRGSVQAAIEGKTLQQATASIPVQFDNAPEIPLVITEAALSFGEAHAKTLPGVTPEGMIVSMTSKGGNVRDFDFRIKMLNQGDRRINEIAVEVSNGQLTRLAVHTATIRNSPEDANQQQGIGSQELFDFKLRLQLNDTINNEPVLNHLYDFRLTVLGVKYEGEQAMLWSESAKKSFPQDGPKPVQKRSVQKPGNDVPNEDRLQQDETVISMSPSIRPKILYRERAQYTNNAREQNVEGNVVLSVVFEADGNVRDIQVVRGLTGGLTESAIEAAKVIRFEPAIKDGQPVDVRGNIEFSFRL